MMRRSCWLPASAHSQPLTFILPRRPQRHALRVTRDGPRDDACNVASAREVRVEVRRGALSCASVCASSHRLFVTVTVRLVSPPPPSLGGRRRCLASA